LSVAAVAPPDGAALHVRSQFTFPRFIDLAQPVSPLLWMADVVLPLLGAPKRISGRKFLDRLLMVNSTRVQSDVLNRIQESRGRLGVEICKVLHEISRIANRR